MKDELDDLFSGEVAHEVRASDGVKKKAIKTARAYFGMAVTAAVVFLTIVVKTTSISQITVESALSLTLDFFLCFLLNYVAYLSMYDSGTQAGLQTLEYRAARELHTAKKKEVRDADVERRMDAFCRWYCAEELVRFRAHLVEPKGIKYDEYAEKYMTLSREEIKASELTKDQKKAVLAANSAKQIRLNTTMIMSAGGRVIRRSPLGLSPSERGMITRGRKLASQFILSLLLTPMAFELVSEPKWTTFVSVMVQVVVVLFNAFLGKINGQDAIVVDRVNYLNDQADLMTRAIRWAELTPEKE